MSEWNKALLFDGTKEESPIPKASTQKLIRGIWIGDSNGGTSDGFLAWVLKYFLFHSRYCVPGNNLIRPSEEGITTQVETEIIETGGLGVVICLRKGSNRRFCLPKIIDPCGSIIIANGNSPSVWRKGDVV